MSLKKDLLNSKYIALTSDGWTDDFRKISYLTVAAHFFDNEVNLHSTSLSTAEVEERKTTEVLYKCVAQVVEEFGLI